MPLYGKNFERHIKNYQPLSTGHMLDKYGLPFCKNISAITMVVHIWEILFRLFQSKIELILAQSLQKRLLLLQNDWKYLVLKVFFLRIFEHIYMNVIICLSLNNWLSSSKVKSLGNEFILKLPPALELLLLLESHRKRKCFLDHFSCACANNFLITW